MRQKIVRLLNKARPTLEGLEGRQLLSGKTAAITLSEDQRLEYNTPQGAHVVISLLGPGSLGGSTVAADGSLNLVYSGTNQLSAIVGKVKGRGGKNKDVPLQSIGNAHLDIDDLSGIGSSALSVVNLKNFDLVSGGQINMTGGVHTLVLNSVASNTQVNLRTLPDAILNGDSKTDTSEGVTLTYNYDSSGALILSSVSGQFVAGENIVEPQPTVGTGASVANVPGPPPAPPGLILAINHVKGSPRIPASIGDPQIFGYDPTANALIRFDATTGAALQLIPMTGLSGPVEGVALGRANGQLVALVNAGTNIYAFNAVTGAAAGQFSTANLASAGLTDIDGIGSTDSQTVVTDSTGGNGGLAQIIDVSASLSTGQAVALGRPYNPQGQFAFSNGATGIPGSQTLFVTGSAYFNTLQPFTTQFGILSLKASTSGQLSSAGESAVLPYQNVERPGTLPPAPLGSVDQNLALLTGVSNGKNNVTLLSPVGFTTQGTLTLNDPNPLSDLTESFRPTLAGAALIDVQGDIQSVRGRDADGLVLNDSGNLNLVKFTQISNSVIIGQPFGHAQFKRRSNVSIITPTRTAGQRNGVTIVKGLDQIGPLSLPS